ncbi:MAG: hypothetical protein AAF773_06335 [Cyanobacteria bacterium P01_D01_bin.115]
MVEKYTVEDSDKLYRWLHPGQFKWDEGRPTSAAFKDPYLSIDIECLTSLQESYERAQKRGKNAVASISVEQAYQKAQKVVHCPTQVLSESPEKSVCQDEHDCPAFDKTVPADKLTCINAAHGCVVGKKTSSISKFFSKTCAVEIYPPEVSV